MILQFFITLSFDLFIDTTVISMNTQTAVNPEPIGCNRHLQSPPSDTPQSQRPTYNYAIINERYNGVDDDPPPYASLVQSSDYLVWPYYGNNLISCNDDTSTDCAHNQTTNEPQQPQQSIRPLLAIPLTSYRIFKIENHPVASNNRRHDDGGERRLRCGEWILKRTAGFAKSERIINY